MPASGGHDEERARLLKLPTVTPPPPPPPQRTRRHLVDKVHAVGEADARARAQEHVERAARAELHHEEGHLQERARVALTRARSVNACSFSKRQATRAQQRRALWRRRSRTLPRTRLLLIVRDADADKFDDLAMLEEAHHDRLVVHFRAPAR